VILGTDFVLDRVENFLLDGQEVGSFIGRRDESGERMSAYDSELVMAEDAFQAFFGLGNRVGVAGEFREENLRLSDFPADIDRGEQAVAVLGDSLLEPVSEILHALVEAMDHLNWPRGAPLKARLGNLAGWFAESGHDHDLGLTDL